ncbi:MAG: hypothetical protein ACYS32_12310 [Planctomycetota bacterium]
MKKLIMMLFAIILLVEGSLLAGPIVLEQFSGSASWVVHANPQQFKKTQTGRLIRNELVNLGLEENLTNFATMFSFHPLDDVRDVTIYGTGQDRKKAVVLIDGIFDKERILSLVSMNSEYKETKYGDIMLHQWLDENQKDPNYKMMYGCFYKDDLIVMGSGLDSVKQAVDVLEGKAKSATSEIVSQTTLSAKGAFFHAAGIRVGEMVEGEDPQAAALKQSDQIGIAIGEDEGKFYINVGLIAKSQEAAQAIKQMLEGIIAFVSLPNEEQPLLAELVKKIKVSCEQSKVQVLFQTEPELVVKFLKEEWQKNQEKQTPTQ